MRACVIYSAHSGAFLSLLRWRFMLPKARRRPLDEVCVTRAKQRQATPPRAHAHLSSAASSKIGGRVCSPSMCCIVFFLLDQLTTYNSMAPRRAKTTEAEQHAKSMAADSNPINRRSTPTRSTTHVAVADTASVPNRTAANGYMHKRVKVAAQPLPAVGNRVTGDAWFQHLFGFSELAALDGCGKMSAVAANFELGADGTLRSLVNGASYGAGFFVARSLADLRDCADRRAVAGELPLGRVVIRHAATPDVYEMHTDRLFAGATVMAASQFNALEFHNPDVTPEEGVTNYTHDRTQGPACALAAPAAAVLRNYFLRMPSGAMGQRAGEQLNLLGDLLRRVQGCTGDPSAAGKLPLVRVRNGYTVSDNQRLLKLNAKIAKLVDGPMARDELLGALRVGLHSRVEVPWAPGGRFVLAAPAERRRLSQVFCSAVACGYSDGPLAAWAPLARLALDGAYEAALLAAVLEASDAIGDGGGCGVALLTFLGGGVFGNKDEWIDAAMARAVVRMRERGVALTVVVVHHGRVDEARKARIAAAIRAEERLRRAWNATTVTPVVAGAVLCVGMSTKMSRVTITRATKHAAEPNPALPVQPRASVPRKAVAGHAAGGKAAPATTLSGTHAPSVTDAATNAPPGNANTNRKSTKNAPPNVLPPKTTKSKTAESRTKSKPNGPTDESKNKRGLSGYNIFIKEYEPRSAGTGTKANVWRDLGVDGRAVYNTKAIAWNNRDAVEQIKTVMGNVVLTKTHKTSPTVLLSAKKATSPKPVAKAVAAKPAIAPTPVLAASPRLGGREKNVVGVKGASAGKVRCASAKYTANAVVQASGAWLVRDVRCVSCAAGHPVDAPLTWAGAIDALCSGDLGPFLCECLCASPHAPSLFWETPAFSRSTLSLPFEFVTLPAPRLARARPDGSAFAAHFRGHSRGTTATFANIRGDATLVIPCPPPGRSALHAPTHGHLCAFVRGAPAAQREALWCAVGFAARDAAKSDDPTWLSTAGSGVPWLHIQLDAAPKYYHHLDYEVMRSAKGQARRGARASRARLAHRRRTSDALGQNAGFAHGLRICAPSGCRHRGEAGCALRTDPARVARNTRVHFTLY